MILELGVRYLPASREMHEAHNQQVAALIADLAHMPPHLLQRAIKDHVENSNFMPRAAQLIAKCQELAAPTNDDASEGERWQRRVREGNRMLIDDGLEDRAHWELGAGGIGCSLREGGMTREAHAAAMTVDPAVYRHLRKRAA